ncbi:hypothetical protein AVEN_231048-1 [Araneus ventricosus]|uniref:RNase H type-1 domain-containing protein n=1 Tax=Araneus ventricosus TaxID=182803 RepID=A0A4Y2A2T7_ARAVE|nr:hypothetical protein AVEN_231048-1 [Araneus ventricosus]
MIQRVFLIKLLRPYITTAKQALNVLSGIPPLHITAKMEYLRFQIWTCRSRGLDGVIDLFKLDKFEKRSEIPLNTRVLELRDKVQDSHFEGYTDGSKADGGVVFFEGILHGEIQHKIICKKLEPQNTVFQAELAALGEAVDWAIENKKKINIYADNNNTRLGRTCAVEKLRESEDIARMDWPAYSPYLSTIEHVWDALRRRLQARLYSSENTQKLKSMLIEKWTSLPQ